MDVNAIYIMIVKVVTDYSVTALQRIFLLYSHRILGNVSFYSVITLVKRGLRSSVSIRTVLSDGH